MQGRRRVNNAARNAGYSVGTANGKSHSRVMTNQIFNRMREKERIESLKSSAMTQNVEDHRRMAANLASEERVERMRRQRRIQQRNAEMLQEQRIEEGKIKQYQREILLEQERKLAAALKEANNRKTYEDSLRQRLCSENEEIKELKRMIHAAQISKVRGNQIMEKEMLKEQHKNEQLRLDGIMEKERQAAVERAAKKEQARHKERMEGRHSLIKQMEERQQAKARAYEDFLKEKEEIDKIVEGVRLEEKRKLELHMKRREEIRAEIKSYLKERREWRRMEAERVAAELQKILEYQKMQEERKAQLEAQKAAKNAKRERMLASIGADIEAKRRAQEEMEQILNDLYEEELRNKQEEEEMMRRDRRERMKKEMYQANEEQKRLKALRDEEEKEEEMKFVRAMLDKFERDNRLEQMSRERRRREIQNYKAEVDRLVEVTHRHFNKSILLFFL